MRHADAALANGQLALSWIRERLEALRRKREEQSDR